MERTPTMVALDALRAILEGAWCAKTTYWPDEWTPARPSAGQCGVTALLVQERFGGEIVAGEVGGVGHYWNRVDGRLVDLTRDQFPRGAKRSRTATVDLRSVLDLDIGLKCRFELLKARALSAENGASVLAAKPTDSAPATDEPKSSTPTVQTEGG